MIAELSKVIAQFPSVKTHLLSFPDFGGSMADESVQCARLAEKKDPTAGTNATVHSIQSVPPVEDVVQCFITQGGVEMFRRNVAMNFLHRRGNKLQSAVELLGLQRRDS